MSFARTSAEAGIKILRHHDRQFEVPVRNVQWGGVLKKHDELGRPVFDDKVDICDEVCMLAWPKADRATGGFANAWPAMLAEGGGGSSNNGDGAGGAAGGGAGFTFGGVRTDFSNGSPNAGITLNGGTPNFNNGGANAGIDVPALNGSPLTGAVVTPDGQDNGTIKPPKPADMPKNSCGSFNVPHTMVPIRNDAWEADIRFKGLDVQTPEKMPKLPRGLYGIAIAGTEEYEQKNLFFPTDPRLFAPNTGGDPGMGTRVYDLGNDFSPAEDRWAPLQSVFRVLFKPLGHANSIAFQLGPSGCHDREGGYVVDLGLGGGGAAAGGGGGAGAPVATLSASGGGGGNAGNTMVMPGLGWVIGMLSVRNGGFIDVGAAGDKHYHGKDGDKNPINSAHISTMALFRQDNEKDGPLRFEKTYEEGEDLDFAVPVHLAWSGHDWALWTTSSQKWEPPPWEPPPPPPPPPWYPNVPYPPSFPNGVPTLGTPTTITPVTPNTGSVPNGVPTVDPRFTPTTATPNPANTEGTMSAPGPANPGPTKPIDPPNSGATTPSKPAGDDWTPEPFNPGDFGPGGKFGPALNSVFSLAMQLATDGINTMATGATSVGQGVMSTPNATSSPCTLSQPPTWGNPSSGKSALASPICGGMSSVGAMGGVIQNTGCAATTNHAGAGGDPWVYTQKPGEGRFGRGTASGGWVIHPPEVTPADQESAGMMPDNVDLSTTYFMTAPGAWFGSGTPLLALGSMTSGWSWGMDTATADLIWRTHDYETISTGMRFLVSSQNFAWYSGTAFYGEFDHSNSANRTYTFVNMSGNVQMLQYRAGSPNGVLSGVQGTLCWDTVGSTLYVNTDGGTTWVALGTGAVAGSGAANRVAYWSNATTITSDAGMTYDAGTDSLTLAGDLLWKSGTAFTMSFLHNITADRNVTFQDIAGTVYVSGGTDVAIADGGTGASTATAGFNALAPTTTRGDLITRDATNNVRLAVGGASTLLKSDGTDPSWGTVNLLSAFHGDTLAGTVVRGDIIVGNATPKWARLAIGSASRVLRSDGTDAAWGQVVLTTDVSGTLPVANGGTGQTTATAAFNALDPITTKGDVITHDGTDSVRLAVGTDGQVLTADSTQAKGIKWASITGTGTAADIQTFTASGTWTKPSGAAVVEVICIAGGGGAGSGRLGASGGNRNGGGGGGSGGISRKTYRASDLGATESVGITGTPAGTGGAAQTSNGTNGNNGIGGADVTFGSGVKTLSATGGGGGTGGDSSASGGVAGGTAGTGMVNGVAGATGGTPTATAPTGTTALVGGAPGGGGGGSVGSGNTERAGGAGGPLSGFEGSAAGGAGGAVGAAGTAGTTGALQGTGGGGGGGGHNRNGGDGATGGSYGAGGGGGGGGTNGSVSGKGGDGGAAIVVVITYF